MSSVAAIARRPRSFTWLASRSSVPRELFASKPGYSATTGNDLTSPPEYLETQFFGRTFPMEALVGSTTTGKSAVNGFKIVATDGKRGAIALQAVPGPDPKFAGSAKYIEGMVSGENRVSQNGNVAVWLVEGGESPWVWVLPNEVGVETDNGVTYLTCDKTWIALHPINMGALTVDSEMTKDLTAGSGTTGSRDSPWKGHGVVLGKGNGGKFCGVAVEVGERPEFADRRALQKAVAA